MHKLMLGALGAATMMLASVPAWSQELPVKGGDVLEVTSVTVDDGHFPDYADFLAGQFRKQSEFAKSKGWLRGYHILSNVNPRADEPDLYLVRVYDHVATPAEDIQREKEMNAFMAQTTRQGAAGSAQRATFRHLKGSMMLQEMLWTK